MRLLRTLQWLRGLLKPMPPAPVDDGIGDVVALFDTNEAARRMAIAQGYGLSRTRLLHTETR